jgi:predicted MPP superfamily phosphohydrolase
MPNIKERNISSYILSFLLIVSQLQLLAQGSSSPSVNIVFTSDAHFGINRKAFKGDTNVSAAAVNKELVNQLNTLPTLTLPTDGGIEAGKLISHIDYLIEGGDIANRMEPPVQSAALSWAQFNETYLNGIKLLDYKHQSLKFLIVPGNHDITNAIGYYRTMQPLTDPTAMVNIYNLMIKPAKPVANQDYKYDKLKINYSQNIAGIHFMFITLWPDSAERIWMEQDLKSVSNNVPAVIVCHDQPTCEAKHFTNPIAPHNMSKDNKFENLVAEYYKEGATAKGDDGATDLEQRGFVKFLKAHPNIKAYFHGNSNWNEFYEYRGPDNDISLPVFRVDSPMKGKYSSKDETQLSFQLISIDARHLRLTVRECLWDTEPLNAATKIKFGQQKTISLEVN